MSLPRSHFSVQKLVLMLDVFGLNTLLTWATHGGNCTVVSFPGARPAVPFQILPESLASRGFTALEDVEQFEGGRMRVAAAVELATDEAAWTDSHIEELAVHLGLREELIAIWTLGTSQEVVQAVIAEVRNRRKDCAEPDCVRLPEFGVRSSSSPLDFRPGEFAAMDGLLTRWAPNVWAWADHKRALGIEDLLADRVFAYRKRTYGHECVLVEVPVADVRAHPILAWVAEASFACVGNPLSSAVGGDDGTRAFHLVPDDLWREWCHGRVCGATWHPSYDAVVADRVSSLRND